MLRAASPQAAPQLFILGLPRSGTTLVYQYVVHRLQVAYFTNGVGDHPYAPCAITWLQRRRHGDYRSDFESAYGKVSGPVAPREAGAVWGRWFGYEDYMDGAALDLAAADRLRRTVWATQRIFGGAPFVNKNVKHMLRIGALAELFPRSEFLVVDRDAGEVALSLLRARQGNAVGRDEWWSVRPRNHEELRDLPAPLKVAGQVEALSAQLDEDVAGLPAERVLRVDYRDFCAEPESLIRLLRASWKVADRSPAVESFRASEAVARTPDERRLLELVA